MVVYSSVGTILVFSAEVMLLLLRRIGIPAALLTVVQIAGVELVSSGPTDDKGGDCTAADTCSKPGVCEFLVQPTLGAQHLTRAPGPP